MTTKAMPLLMNREGQHLELRNSADQIMIPATELKTGEDARAAAKRAVEEFFGFNAPEDAIKEGFQARVGNEVVAVYPVDTSKMEMALLRPAEEAATWAWRDVPPSMGNVVALGFPRNVERRNTTDALTDADGTVAGAGVARANGLVNVFGPGHATPGAPSGPGAASHPEAEAQYHLLADAVAAKAAGLKGAAAHERAARAEELAQATEDLRLLAADMGVAAPGARLNAADAAAQPYTTARALIRQNDGTILAARQKDGRSLLPGGHLENGEDAEAAVARELQEELGLDIKDALTGEGYDFHGEDGSKHRVFVVDGGKLDMSKLVPGDDVADAEFENSPFTDSHGQVHPAPDTAEQVDDVAEIERHVEGIAHEVVELERKNSAERRNHIEKLGDGKYCLLSHEGKNLGDFDSHEAAAKHEGDVEYFKAHPKENAGEDKCEDCGAAINELRAEFSDKCPACAKKALAEKDAPKTNDAGAHGHEYMNKMEGPFPVIRCNSAESVATQEDAGAWRCEACGDVIAGPVQVKA